VKLTLQTKIGVSFALGLITLSLAGLMAWRANDRQTSDAIQVNHSHDVISALEALRSIVTDGEAGMRGYVITGDLAYLDPYRNDLSAIDNSYFQRPGTRAASVPCCFSAW